MDCRTFIEFLMDYLGAGLGAEARGTFEEHLAECPECVAYLRQYEQTVRLGKACCEPDAAVPAEVPEDLVRAILAARAAERASEPPG